MKEIFCGSCGFQNSTENNFCTNCGGKLIKIVESNSKDTNKSPSKRRKNVNVKIQTKNEPQIIVSEILDVPKENSSYKGYYIFFAAVLLMIYFFSGPKSSIRHNMDGSVSSSLSHNQLEAYSMTQIFVKNRLKSPSTVDFPTLALKCVVSEADSTFKVISYVDSQNGFGATIRTHFQAILKYNGGDIYDISNWQLIDIYWPESENQ